MKKLLIAVSFILSIPLFAAPIDELTKIVNMNSGTSNIKGVEKTMDYAIERLKKMNFVIERLAHPTGKFAQLLIARRNGTTAKYISVLAHADTVFDEPTKFQSISFSDDKKMAYGPGVVDDKGGLIVALTGMEKYLTENPQTKHSFQFVITPNEEIGSDGYMDKMHELALTSYMVLTFEGTLENGNIVDSRKGNRWYEIKVIGREAHAGRDHKLGINACVELSSKLVDLFKLTDYGKEVTVSVGHIEGGKDKFNIVCDHAEAKLDVRFMSLSERDKVHAQIDKILKSVRIKANSDGKGAETSYQVVDDTAPFSPSKESRPTIAKYLKAIEKVEGKKLSTGSSAGVADTNHFSIPGMILLDGLGPEGGKMHTEGEWLKVDSLQSRADAFTEFLKSL